MSQRGLEGSSRSLPARAGKVCSGLGAERKEGNRPEQVKEQHAKGSLWQHTAAEQGIGSVIQERLPALKLLTLDFCTLVYYRNFVIHLTCKLHL